jgi:GntR family transcriptional regulator
MEESTRPLRLDSRPLYDQAIEALQQYIQDGQHQPGDRLPSEGALARQLGISRSTLREAMGYLESHGLVTRRHGSGTFVALPPQPVLHAGLEQLESLYILAKRVGAAVERRTWRVDALPAQPEIAAALELASGAEVARAEMTAALNGVLFAYLTGYASVEFAPPDELASYAGGSLLDFLNEREQLRIASCRSEIFSAGANHQAARELDVALGSPLLYLKETQFNETGQPLIYSLNYFRTDSYNFHVVRRAPRR